MNLDRLLSSALFGGIFAFIICVGYVVVSGYVRETRRVKVEPEAQKAAPSVGGIEIFDLPDGRRAYTLRNTTGVAIFVMEQPRAEPE